MTAEQVIDSIQAPSGMVRFPSRLYYVESSHDPSVRLAMDIIWNQEQQTISWFNTLRTMQFAVGEVLSAKPEFFTFAQPVEQGGGLYTLIPLTLEIYNKKIKPTLYQPPHFDNDGQLFTFCRQRYIPSRRS